LFVFSHFGFHTFGFSQFADVAIIVIARAILAFEGGFEHAPLCPRKDGDAAFLRVIAAISAGVFTIFGHCIIIYD
jgi:hypothetical protein